MIERIHWLGHASFLIEGTPTILIDPWRVVYEGPAPDLILISHEHYDHCSPADVNKLRGRHTQIIASRGAAAVLDCPCTVLRPWQVVNWGRTSIRAVPSYTFSGDHPVQREDIGFVISQNYTDIYYAGDTDFVPELRSLRADVDPADNFPRRSDECRERCRIRQICPPALRHPQPHWGRV